MEDIKQIWQFYANNFTSTIDSILYNSDIKTIQHTLFPHALSKIKQFEESFSDEDIRKEFIQKLLSEMEEAKLHVEDKEHKERHERRKLLNELEQSLFKILPEIKTVKALKLNLSNKIILLEYLGIIQHLRSKDISETNLAHLIALIADSSIHNTEDRIRTINLYGKKATAKNARSLDKVKEVIEKLNLDFLCDKVNHDIAELNKGK